MTDLDSAYGLETADDNLRLYREWANSYDRDFAQEMDYVLPLRVAEAFQANGGRGPVLDLGAGTGLCGVALHALGMAEIDACDLSQDMLEVATGKNVYRRLFTGNMQERLPVEDASYGGVVSSGTFTHGHVGPEALGEVLRVVVPGGVVALSINAEHWRAQDYDGAFKALGARIEDLTVRDLRIYGDKAQGPHAGDMSRVTTFRKKGGV